jgi:hypothetical protein
LRRRKNSVKVADMCALIERSTVKVVPHDQVSGGAARSPCEAKSGGPLLPARSWPSASGQLIYDWRSTRGKDRTFKNDRKASFRRLRVLRTARSPAGQPK